MKALSYRQATSCENAKSPRSACRCRCLGAAHGRGVASENAPDVTTLPIGDPHRVEAQGEFNLSAERTG